VRVEPAGAAFLIGQIVVEHDPVARADRAQRPQTLLAAEGLAVDLEALLAVGVGEALRPPVAEGRIDVMLPQIDRFEHVPVGVDDIIGLAHSICS